MTELDRHAQRIDNAMPQKGRVLHIGCGDGWLMERLKRLGHDVFGVEASLALSLIHI
jgi:2-polyprenyl-3-methyl-5-hydroxy-6-metoxy-1,4-benzoquinol methylase